MSKGKPHYPGKGPKYFTNDRHNWVSWDEVARKSVRPYCGKCGCSEKEARGRKCIKLTDKP